MVIYDEADEIFNNIETQKILKRITDEFDTLSPVPQYLLFSATVDEATIANFTMFIKPVPRLF